MYLLCNLSGTTEDLLSSHRRRRLFYFLGDEKMSKELEKQYDPSSFEDRTYKFWVDNEIGRASCRERV